MWATPNATVYEAWGTGQGFNIGQGSTTGYAVSAVGYYSNSMAWTVLGTTGGTGLGYMAAITLDAEMNEFWGGNW